MKQKTKKKLGILAIKIFKISVALIIIIMIYSSGRIRGLIDGIYVTQIKHNETVCDFMNKTRDTDGFCLIVEGEHKYRYYLDCGWEKFKINGEKKPTFLMTVAEDIRRIILYPMIGC